MRYFLKQRYWFLIVPCELSYSNHTKRNLNKTVFWIFFKLRIYFAFCYICFPWIFLQFFKDIFFRHPALSSAFSIEKVDHYINPQFPFNVIFSGITWKKSAIPTDVFENFGLVMTGVIRNIVLAAESFFTKFTWL